MAIASNHPSSAYKPPLSGGRVAVFANEEDRRRYTPTALKAYLNIVRDWKLSLKEAALLLGVSQSTWERIKREPTKAAPLNQDQLTRLSAIIGLYKGLHLLFADEMADRWVQLSNRGPLFGGKTPVVSMIEGGIPQMLDTRRYVDAIRGGL